MMLLAMALTGVLAWAVWRSGEGRRARQVLEQDRLRNLAQEAIRSLPCGGDGVLVTDALGRVLQMNAFAERLCGWTREEARGRPLEEVLPLVDPPSPTSPVPEAGDSGLEAGLPLRRRLVRRDGSLLPVRVVRAPIPGAKGTPLGQVVVFRDRSEGEEIETRLRDLESRFRQFFEGSLLGICWLDAEGRILDADRAFCGLVGRSREDLRGTAWRDLVATGDRYALESAMARLLSGVREPVETELRYVLADGSIQSGHHRVQGLRDEADRLVAILVHVQPRYEG
jgi:PAS domain S-box-containing protein